MCKQMGSAPEIHQEPVQLSTEEANRMSKLYEEVSGRLEEMALIVSRNLGLVSDEPIQPFFMPAAFKNEKPDHSEEEENGQPVAEIRKIQMKPIKIICTPRGCGCYDDNTQTCYVC